MRVSCRARQSQALGTLHPAPCIRLLEQKIENLYK